MFSELLLAHTRASLFTRSLTGKVSTEESLLAARLGWHYRPLRVLAPTFRRLAARPATVSFRLSRARSAATVSPGLRR